MRALTACIKLKSSRARPRLCAIFYIVVLAAGRRDGGGGGEGMVSGRGEMNRARDEKEEREIGRSRETREERCELVIFVSAVARCMIYAAGITIVLAIILFIIRSRDA